MASGNGIRTVCGAIAVASVVLGVSGARAEDLLRGEQVEATDIDDAAGMATAGGGSRLWSRQPGTSAYDSASDVATDKDGNVYVVGATEGALGGPNKGGSDGWVIKLDSDGRRVWVRQPGTSAYDSARGVATDEDGNVYVVGLSSDAWVIKLDVNGQRLWKRTLGFVSPLGLFPLDIATDKAGNVYAVGYTEVDEAFVFKLDSDGNVLWTRQPGTSDAQGVATDKDGNVYVVGGTCTFCDTDAFVIKFDGAGNVLWTRQPGTSEFDRAYGVATDGHGNVYVVGETYGALAGANKGADDAWVIKFAGDGHRLWSRQPGTSELDRAFDVATNKVGNVYVVGETGGALGGPTKGNGDAWVVAFDSDGNRVWTRQPGTSAGEFAFGVATDKVGNVYVVGETYGALGGPKKGNGDAWVIKYAR